MNKLKINQLLFVIIILLIACKVNAQDLIVTYEGDSLNCKITKIKSDFIYFTFKHKNEYRNTLLSFEDVKYHQYNFYNTYEVPKDKVVLKDDFPHFRLAFTGGYSYRTGKVPDDLDMETEDYLKKLKSGYHLGADLSYFFSEYLGCGMKYNIFRSKNELNYYLPTSTGYGSGLISDDISITFIGPFFTSRFFNVNKQNCLIMNLGMGYLGYNDNASVTSNFKIKGSTLGLSWDIGYDIGISKNVAFGFQLSYVMGTLTQYKTNEDGYYETIELEEGSYEDLSRIDLSIGIRFNK